jgi:hypothetical protein
MSRESSQAEEEQLALEIMVSDPLGSVFLALEF